MRKPPLPRRILLIAPTCIVAFGFGTAADAATPVYYDSRAEFEAVLVDSVVDDYSDPGYVFIQNNATMSGVLGETDYETTGFVDLNIIANAPADPRYCAGCNGSFELSFLTTSVGTAQGVEAVGFDIVDHSMAVPYFALITFADGDTDNVALPPGGSFWGVASSVPVERIHVGLTDGGTTTTGNFSIDDLTIGEAAFCGDGLVGPGESCDDAGESATCDANCTEVSCGDGTINVTAGEDCDDAGESATCNADCTTASCGDGTINGAAGEDCDDAGESPTCDDDCSLATCGDGTLNTAALEECDDAGESATCDDDCSTATCGDGTLNTTALEECDDAGESAVCDDDCSAATCGDGTVNNTAGETCDDMGKSATCNGDCTTASCGDGYTNATAGEECDGDGAGTPGETDACDDDCTAAMCGDMVVNATAGEECDDGNTDDGDGCAADCLMEAETTDSETGTGDESGDGTGDESGDGTGDESGDGTGDDTGGASGDGSGGATTNQIPVDPDGSGGADGSTGGGDGSGGGASDDGGCGCSSTQPSGGGLAWGFGAFVLAALRRRRR